MCPEKQNQYYPSKSVTSANLKRKTNQSDTNYMQDKIVMHAKEHGCFLWRINVMGVYRPGKKYINELKGGIQEEKGKYTISGSTLGVPDLVGAMADATIFTVEAKFGKDTMKGKQIDRMKQVKGVKGIHIIAKSWEHYLREWSMIPPKHYTV